MSSAGGNLDNPLELIQKTYHLQTTTTTATAVNNHENSSQTRPSIAKISSHQPSRKTSVHDVHEATRVDLNKKLGEIHENLSRLQFLLETMNSAENIKEEFNKLKNDLFSKIIECISKLTTETSKRGSIVSKSTSSNLISFHPQHLVYSIEYFRNELLKAKYLFTSLTIKASIGEATLDTVMVKAISNPNNIPNPKDNIYSDDLLQIEKDISNLEEHAYVLNQRYYSQIPDWHTLDDMPGKTMVGTGAYTGSNLQHLRLAPLTQKLSTASSTTSIERSTFCARLYQKCQMVCCICTPKYL